MEPVKIIQGIVQRGHSRGKQMGFPTINFSLSEQIPDGIYLSYITISGRKYNALTFIGSAKTFDEKEVQAETYVLDFDRDVYGEEVSVSLLKKMRENKKFDSVDDLVTQMEEDKKLAEEFFNKI